LLVGQQEGKNLGVGLLVVMICLELCTSHLSASVVTTISIILSCNNIWFIRIVLENGR